jgi:ABC-type molybdenum transport system ATPase subunit/photorepair protein PhrA
MRAHQPYIRITGSSFFRQNPIQFPPGSHTPTLFPSLNFELRSDVVQAWAVIGASLSGKSTLLRVLQGDLICHPPRSRSYPYHSDPCAPASDKTKPTLIQYIGFDATSARGAVVGNSLQPASHLSARYESRRDSVDFTLNSFLKGHLQLNPHGLDPNAKAITDDNVKTIAEMLNLSMFLDIPVSFLSNGQGRRALVARALLRDPTILLLDEPFLGLDPPTARTLNSMLGLLATKGHPRVVISLRPHDIVPEWITHVVTLQHDCRIEHMGTKREVQERLQSLNSRPTIKSPISAAHINDRGQGRTQWRLDNMNAPRKPDKSGSTSTRAEPLIQMDGCVVKYGDRIILGDWKQQTPAGAKQGLVWTVRRGERWGVFGPNGSGKTTLVSIICSDHPQSYSLPLRLFGRGRIADGTDQMPPMSIWDLQSRIGHSSPEVHRQMPRCLSVRRVLESSWAETFLSRPKLNDQSRYLMDRVLDWFEDELNPTYRLKSEKDIPQHHWADSHTFGALPFTSQRVALFLRAVIKAPDIIILDEAFSGMDNRIKAKCMRFLDAAIDEDIGPDMLQRDPWVTTDRIWNGISERQAMICISHSPDECPDVRQWVYLPDAGSGLPARFGKFREPLSSDPTQWDQIWDLDIL